jgi:ribosomal protein S25
MTTSENDPVVAEARPVEARPVSARESRIRLATKKTEEPPVTVITKSPLRVQHQGSRRQTTKERSPTPEARLSQSRRDKVRDKKKKDMEAASLKRRSMISISRDLQPDSEQETIKESPQEKVEEPPPLPLRSPQRQSMCPIMIVANVKPSPPPTAVIPASPKRQTATNPEDLTFAVKLKPDEAAPKQEDDASSRAISPSPPSYQNGSPTPPQSAHSSPTHKLDSQDRTSLSRRREWSAAREQERKRKEAASNASPRPRVRRAVTMREDTGDKAPTVEKEVLRRYEVYREYRIREMERRIRRLERNGDVWLRALVPVLDNLNRTLANSQDGHPSGAKGWISDDDRSNFQATTKMRPSSRGRMMARSGTSEREFLEQLVRTKEGLEAGSVSDDMSGFDTIEPLMRELAGRSRLSFEARSLGMDDEGLLHSLSE